MKHIHRFLGVSQNPNTKDYIIVFENYQLYCEKCEQKYINELTKWCKPCQIDYFKNNFTNWTSGNKQIDIFIQEKQLNIEHSWSTVFDWIPYNQFNDIKEISRDD